MSKLFDEAVKIVGLERNLTIADYKRYKEIERKIPDSEEENLSLLGEALFQRLPEIAAKEGNYNFLEEEDK